MEKHLFLPLALEAEGDEISAFAAGGAACVVVGETVATAPANLGATEPFQIVWKKSDGVIITSPILQLSWAYEKQTADYAAGTKQVTNITPVLPSVQAYGDRYSVRVIDTTPGTMNLPAKTFEVVKTGADFTVATLIDAFVAKIGTDTDVKVVASDSTTTLTLTGTTFENHFKIALDGELRGDVVTYTTPLVPMNGEDSQMTILEQETIAAQQGVTNQVHLSQFSVPNSQVVAGKNHDVYTSMWARPVKTKDGMKSHGVEFYSMIIAEDQTDTPATDHLGHLLNAEI